MIKYGFYNSVNGDRTYSAEDFSKLFDGIIEDGVFKHFDEGMAVSVSSSVQWQVHVGRGRAWFNRTWTVVEDGGYDISISPSSASLSRYDAVVLKIDETDAVRENSIYIEEGVPSLNPQKPVATPTDKIHYYILAYIKVDAGSSAAVIEDNRGAIGCPWAKISTVEFMDEAFVNGPMTVNGKMILGRTNYGPVLPESGVEGQVFFRLT